MIDPRSVPRGGSLDATTEPVPSRKIAHPWAWLVGLAVAVLLVWGFFGMDHLKLDVEPAASPAAMIVD